MRTKQVKSLRFKCDERQLTLFSIFDTKTIENPLTPALPADGGSVQDRLPMPSSSGPISCENPTTTALNGKRTENESHSSEDSPVRSMTRSVAALLRDGKTVIDNRRLDSIARETLGSAVGHARDAYDAAEAGMNIVIGESAINFSDGADSIGWLSTLTGRMP